MNKSTCVLGLMFSWGWVGMAAGQTPSPTPDYAKIAHSMVADCAGITKGNLVLITGGTRDLELLENIAIEVRKLGGDPMISIGSERLAQRSFTDVPATFDTQEPTFDLKLADLIDATISVDFVEHPDFMANIPADRRNTRAKAYQPVTERMLKSAVRQVSMGNGIYPTTARASQFGMNQNDLSRIFWSGVNVDYSQLQSTGEAIQRLLTAGKELKITAANGTNLTLGIAQRPSFVSDGVISGKDCQGGGPGCQVWLPAGEVYLTPATGTANGTFIADTFFYEGKLIEGLNLTFANGKLTDMTAKGDLAAVKKLYDTAPTGKDVFGFVDIGINRNIKAPANSRMVSWMGAGNISIGIGGNTWAGGDNPVAYDLSAHLVGGTLTVDGKAIVEKGNLLTGG